MSGIRTGTRREELERLRQRVDHRRQAALRRHDHSGAARLFDLLGRIDTAIAAEPSALPPKPAPAPCLMEYDTRMRERIAALGVTTAQIRKWALANDIEVGARGRISFDVIEMWADAHRQDI